MRLLGRRYKHANYTDNMIFILGFFLMYGWEKDSSSFMESIWENIDRKLYEFALDMFE